jgi:hypothetical protein
MTSRLRRWFLILVGVSAPGIALSSICLMENPPLEEADLPLITADRSQWKRPAGDSEEVLEEASVFELWQPASQRQQGSIMVPAPEPPLPRPE